MEEKQIIYRCGNCAYKDIPRRFYGRIYYNDAIEYGYRCPKCKSMYLIETETDDILVNIKRDNKC